MFNEELYDLLLRRDDEFSNELEDAMLLKEVFVSQIKLLEERRFDLTEKANTLVTKRLIEDVDRKQFSEHVQELRRKVKIFDLNIQKCNELLQRLNQTSVGTITKYVTQFDEEQSDDLEKHTKRTPKKTHRQTHEQFHDCEPTLTELIAELIEEKIVDDIKKQLIRNKMPHRYEHTGYGEGNTRQSRFDEDDEDEGMKKRQDKIRKRKQYFR
jgi:transposase